MKLKSNNSRLSHFLTYLIHDQPTHQQTTFPGHNFDQKIVQPNIIHHDNQELMYLWPTGSQWEYSIRCFLQNRKDMLVSLWNQLAIQCRCFSGLKHQHDVCKCILNKKIKCFFIHYYKSNPLYNTSVVMSFDFKLTSAVFFNNQWF